MSLAALGSACCGLRYRFGATLRFALLTHPPHASRSSLLTFYFVFRHIFALPCLNYLHFILFYIVFQAPTRLNLEYTDFFYPDFRNYTLF
ncbi:MAG: hypothetical protein NZ519_11750 [Bacteroidia bacterium]|nr:hypothetical protein [Bacteroidia bacterium]MDW8348508.1 hypothetical protein [Bacteroidia bacterium]